MRDWGSGVCSSVRGGAGGWGGVGLGAGAGVMGRARVRVMGRAGATVMVRVMGRVRRATVEGSGSSRDTRTRRALRAGLMV
jgi:hypothetical protein